MSLSITENVFLVPLPLSFLLTNVFPIAQLVILGPLLLSLGVNIYNKINTIAAPCPVCGIQLSGLKNAPSECPRYVDHALAGLVYACMHTGR